MVKELLRMGDPRLYVRSAEVEQFDTPALHALVQDMMDTMKAAGGAGLAAPQIGVQQRVVIFGFDMLQRYPDAPPVPLTVLINPVLKPLSEETESAWEGCLSVPGLRGVVPRFKRLQYTGFDQFGAPIDRKVDGFHARVVQHECDHLDGVLYPMRVKDFTQFGYADVLFPNRDMVDD